MNELIAWPIMVGRRNELWYIEYNDDKYNNIYILTIYIIALVGKYHNKCLSNYYQS